MVVEHHKVDRDTFALQRNCTLIDTLHLNGVIIYIGLFVGHVAAQADKTSFRI